MTQPSFHIRTAQNGDQDAIFSLIGGYEGNLPPKDSPYHPAHCTALIMAAVKDTESKSKCWLAIAGSQCVGIITTHDLNGGVRVLDDYQGKGIGSALVSAREAFLRDHLTCTESRATMLANNQKSIGMHLGLGYEFERNSSGAVILKTNPSGQSILHMVKKLSGPR